MKNTLRNLSIIVMLALAVPAWGQAYCALRDPSALIYTTYKDATSFRSIVRTINSTARAAVNQRLPFGIHFNELGRHTLYVVVTGKRPIGLIHARSERSRWGLVEIAWDLDLDLRIRGFQFQRCRSPQRRELENERLQEQLRGKTFTELASLLHPNGNELRRGAIEITDDAAHLAATVLRCGLKTIAATEAAWLRDLQSARTKQAAYAAFGADLTSLKRINRPYVAKGALSQRRARLRSGFIVEKDVQLTVALDADRNPAGLVARTPCVIGKTSLVLWWIIDHHGQIKQVRQLGGWNEDLTRDSFTATVGRSLKTASDDSCSTPADAIALDLLYIATPHLIP